MATDVEPESEPGLATLAGGIISDAQKLIGQQFALFREEVKGEIRQAKTAAVSLAIGAGIAAIGGMLLVIMTVHLLAAHTEIPLWGCYGIVGAVTAAIGAGLISYGAKEAADVHLIAPPQAMEAMKENLQWITKQKTSV